MLLYIALFIEFVLVVLDKSDYTIQFQSYWFRLTFVLFGIKVLCTKYSKKEWGAVFLFDLFGVASYLIPGRNEIIRVVVFIVAFKNLDIKHVLKYTFVLTGLGCLVLVGLSFAGIGTIKLLDTWRGYPEIRYCIGMGHPNAMHCMFWAL